MKLIMIYLMTLLALFSCGSKNKPQEKTDKKMVRFTYSVQGSMCWGSLYEAKRDSNNVIVSINLQEPEDHVYKANETVSSDLQIIIDKYKMYNYKESYTSKFEVMDGESWQLDVEYEDTMLSFNSHGNNAGPSGAAFNEVKNYFINRFMKSTMEILQNSLR